MEKAGPPQSPAHDAFQSPTMWRLEALQFAEIVAGLAPQFQLCADHMVQTPDLV